MSTLAQTLDKSPARLNQSALHGEKHTRNKTFSYQTTQNPSVRYGERLSSMLNRESTHRPTASLDLGTLEQEPLLSPAA